MPHLASYDRERIVATLRQQHGVIARRQALACAMPAPTIRYRVRPDGPWQAVLPGVYRDGQGVLTDKQRAVAAFLYAGRAVAITGTAAIAWHGAPVKRSDVVDVLVPLHHKRCDAGFARLHRTSVAPGALYRDGPVEYAPLDRAIVDAARYLTDLSETRDLVASAVQSGKVVVGHLARELENAGPVAGSARVRLVLAEVADGVRSVAEADLRKLIIQAGLPAPLYNADLFVGGVFLARPDAWWPDGGVAVEVDSMAWHLTPSDYQRTQVRHSRMIAEGIRVLHFAPRLLRTSRRDVAEQIRATLGQSTGPLPHIETRPRR